MVETKLDFIRAACTNDRLFEAAVNDAIEALMRRATLGRSLTDATTQLDLWRQYLDEGMIHHDQRRKIRIRLRPRSD